MLDQSDAAETKCSTRAQKNTCASTTEQALCHWEAMTRNALVSLGVNLLKRDAHGTRRRKLPRLACKYVRCSDAEGQPRSRLATRDVKRFFPSMVVVRHAQCEDGEANGRSVTA